MIKSLFGKKQRGEEEKIVAPLSGKLVRLEDVPDPVFSQKLMGDGMAIEPSENLVIAPFAGQVVQVFHTKHAIGLRSRLGVELLIHIGLETVNLSGEGFTPLVKEGQKVKVGDPLMEIDLTLIRERAASTITPIVITNSDSIANIEKAEPEIVKKGESQIIEVKLK